MLRGGTSTTNRAKQTLPYRVVSVFAILIIFLLSVVFMRIEYGRAVDLNSRSVGVGSSLPSVITTHEFRFTSVTAGSVGSILFDYCSNLPFYGAPCTAPTGLNVDSSTLLQQSGITGFTISAPDTTANRIVLTRATAAAAPTAALYRFGNITNQSTTNETVYVRISIHSSLNGTGSPIDNGTVVYSTAEGVGVGGYVPPHLTFCVGVTVAPNCSTTDGSLLNLGELSETEPKTTTSQFAAATNDPTGYNTFVSGGTMTAGNEIVPALATNSSSQPGTSQFGINLRSNSNPSVGANVSGAGVAGAITGYNTSDSFRYVDGELIARSVLPTEFNRFTVTYLVNISADQRPGIYTSSFTFTAVASF